MPGARPIDNLSRKDFKNRERCPEGELLRECAETCRDTMESVRRIGSAGAEF